LEPRGFDAAAAQLFIGPEPLQRIPADEAANNIRRIVERLEAAGITVILHPLIPLEGAEDRVANLNRIVETSLRDAHAKIVPLPITLVDLMDGIHPLPIAYRKWRDTILPLACPR
jgi:hypothetical protein